MFWVGDLVFAEFGWSCAYGLGLVCVVLYKVSMFLFGLLVLIVNLLCFVF